MQKAKNIPDISVVVAVYNTENYLEKCIKSVVEQNDVNCELIIVDDGSEDNSLSICKSFMKNYENIRLIIQENSGLSAARNAGLKLAKGRYITFVDSDDFVDRDFFKKIRGLLMMMLI